MKTYIKIITSRISCDHLEALVNDYLATLPDNALVKTEVTTYPERLSNNLVFMMTLTIMEGRDGLPIY